MGSHAPERREITGKHQYRDGVQRQPQQYTQRVISTRNAAHEPVLWGSTVCLAPLASQSKRGTSFRRGATSRLDVGNNEQIAARGPLTETIEWPARLNEGSHPLARNPLHADIAEPIEERQLAARMQRKRNDAVASSPACTRGERLSGDTETDGDRLSARPPRYRSGSKNMDAMSAGCKCGCSPIHCSKVCVRGWGVAQTCRT